MACDNWHEDARTEYETSGTDARGNEWKVVHYKCYSCGATWTEDD